MGRTLEHCTDARMHACVEKLLPHVLKHATHKTASNVVGCLLVHSNLDCQAAIADAFLAGKGEMSLETIAATRYGSFVVHHLVDRFHPRIDAVKARVKAAHRQLQESSFSNQKIVNFLGEAFFRDFLVSNRSKQTLRHLISSGARLVASLISSKSMSAEGSGLAILISVLLPM